MVFRPRVMSRYGMRAYFLNCTYQTGTTITYIAYEVWSERGLQKKAENSIKDQRFGTKNGVLSAALSLAYRYGKKNNDNGPIGRWRLI
jgi:hypothetical protein